MQFSQELWNLKFPPTSIFSFSNARFSSVLKRCVTCLYFISDIVYRLGNVIKFIGIRVESGFSMAST